MSEDKTEYPQNHLRVKYGQDLGEVMQFSSDRLKEIGTCELIFSKNTLPGVLQEAMEEPLSEVKIGRVNVPINIFELRTRMEEGGDLEIFTRADVGKGALQTVVTANLFVKEKDGKLEIESVASVPSEINLVLKKISISNAIRKGIDEAGGLNKVFGDFLSEQLKGKGVELDEVGYEITDQELHIKMKREGWVEPVVVPEEEEPVPAPTLPPTDEPSDFYPLFPDPEEGEEGKEHDPSKERPGAEMFKAIRRDSMNEEVYRSKGNLVMLERYISITQPSLVSVETWELDEEENALEFIKEKIGASEELSEAPEQPTIDEYLIHAMPSLTSVEEGGVEKIVDRVLNILGEDRSEEVNDWVSALEREVKDVGGKRRWELEGDEVSRYESIKRQGPKKFADRMKGEEDVEVVPAVASIEPPAAPPEWTEDIPEPKDEDEPPPSPPPLLPEVETIPDREEEEELKASDVRPEASEAVVYYVVGEGGERSLYVDYWIGGTNTFVSEEYSVQQGGNLELLDVSTSKMDGIAALEHFAKVKREKAVASLEFAPRTPEEKLIEIGVLESTSLTETPERTPPPPSPTPPAEKGAPDEGEKEEIKLSDVREGAEVAKAAENDFGWEEVYWGKGNRVMCESYIWFDRSSPVSHVEVWELDDGDGVAEFIEEKLGDRERIDLEKVPPQPTVEEYLKGAVPSLIFAHEGEVRRTIRVVLNMLEEESNEEIAGWVDDLEEIVKDKDLKRREGLYEQMATLGPRGYAQKKAEKKEVVPEPETPEKTTPSPSPIPSVEKWAPDEGEKRELKASDVRPKAIEVLVVQNSAGNMMTVLWRKEHGLFVVQENYKKTNGEWHLSNMSITDPFEGGSIAESFKADLAKLSDKDKANLISIEMSKAPRLTLDNCMRAVVFGEEEQDVRKKTDAILQLAEIEPNDIEEQWIEKLVSLKEEREKLGKGSAENIEKETGLILDIKHTFYLGPEGYAKKLEEEVDEAVPSEPKDADEPSPPPPLPTSPSPTPSPAETTPTKGTKEVKEIEGLRESLDGLKRGRNNLEEAFLNVEYAQKQLDDNRESKRTVTLERRVRKYGEALEAAEKEYKQAVSEVNSLLENNTAILNKESNMKSYSNNLAKDAEEIYEQIEEADEKEKHDGYLLHSKLVAERVNVFLDLAKRSGHEIAGDEEERVEVKVHRAKKDGGKEEFDVVSRFSEIAIGSNPGERRVVTPIARTDREVEQIEIEVDNPNEEIEKWDKLRKEGLPVRHTISVATLPTAPVAERERKKSALYISTLLSEKKRPYSLEIMLERKKIEEGRFRKPKGVDKSMINKLVDQAVVASQIGMTVPIQSYEMLDYGEGKTGLVLQDITKVEKLPPAVSLRKTLSWIKEFALTLKIMSEKEWKEEYGKYE